MSDADPFLIQGPASPPLVAEAAHPVDDLDDGDWHECWSCGGEGVYYDCVEEYACIDPEGGCDLCERRCDVCRGNGGFADTEDDQPSQPEPA